MAWYAKFDGIDGSCKQKDHDGWCVASRCNMSGQKAGGGGTGVSRVGGKMHLADLGLGIITDKGLPKLMEAAVKGKVFSKVEIHGTATYGDAGEQTYLAVELENVQITSYQLGVLDNDAATDDMSISLNFEKVKTTFTAYNKEGKSEGKVEHEWKVEEGEA
jgi:type VI secretion system secreted protein Hcp